MSEPINNSTGQPSQWSSAGFKLARFGKGRNAIQSIFANDLVDALNSLGRIEIVRVPNSEGARDRVLYSDANVTLELLEQDLAPNVEGSVTVSESDGSPSVTNVTEIKFPNGTVTNDGAGVVTIASSLTVEESDGAPTVAGVKKIKFSGATVTDDGSGVVTVATSGQLQMYRLKSVQGDYITCRTWDGTTEGGSDVYLAKPHKLRNSITSQTIDGVTVDYTLSLIHI
jgi:hypothetical protein